MRLRDVCRSVLALGSVIAGFHCSIAFANELAQSFTLDGQLLQAGSDQPLLDANAKIVVDVLDPSKTCILYEESQLVNTSATNGYYSIQIGSDVGSGKRTTNDPHLPMAQIFQNNTAMTGNNAPGQTCAGGTFTPAAPDSRYFRITVTPSATNVADTLSPDTVLDSVPSAIVAQTLQGLDASSFLQVNSTAPADLTQANLENIFSTTNFPRLQTLLSVPPGNYLQDAPNGSVAIPQVSGSPGSGLSTGQFWYDSVSNRMEYYNGTSVQTVGAAGSGISSLTVGNNLTANGTAGGTLTSAGTVDLSITGITAGTYTKLVVDTYGRATSGSQITGSDIASGTIGGTTVINTSGAITTTGNITSLNVSANAGSFRSIVLNDSGSPMPNTAALQAPAAISTSYSLTLPSALPGTSGYMLTSDTSGNLSWTAPSAGSVTSVNMTVPTIMSVTGGPITSSGTFVVSLANENANLVFAGPTGGAAGAPAFRSLVAGDLPALPNTSLQNSAITLGTTSVALGSTAGSLVALSSVGLGVNGTTTGTLTMANGAAGGATTSVQPSTITTTAWTMKLPSNGGTNGYVLQTDGAGNTSWVNVPATGGTFTSGDGSAASPGLTFAGDTNTGFYDTTATHTLGLSSSGSTIFSFSSGGMVSPTAGGANVTSAAGTAAAPTYSFAGDPGTGWFRPAPSMLAASTGGNERMRIDNNGNVGIGTTSPSSVLSISVPGNNVNAGLIQTAASTGYNYLRAKNTGADALFGVTDSGGGIGLVNGLPYASVVGSYNSTAFQLMTNDTARMTIDTTGNVGIGTTAPASQLEVLSTFGSDSVLRVTQGGTAVGNTAWLVLTGGNTNGIGGTSGVVDFWDTNFNVARISSVNDATWHDTGNLVFSTRNPGGSLYERMRITESGNVGIGTTSPGAQFDVNGAGSGSVFGYPTLMMLEAPNGNPWSLSIRRDDLGVNSDIAVYNGGNASGGSWDFAVGDGAGGSVYPIIANKNTVTLVGTGGNVGIGTTAPRAGLDVASAIVTKPATNNSTTTIDFSTGNLQYTTLSCQNFNLNNLKDGGSYMFVVEGATSATCSFNAFSDAGVTALGVRLPPGFAATIPSTFTVFNLVVVGTNVLVSWVPGY